MDNKEKKFLLQLILEDIRDNWAWENKPRIPMALKLANDLGLIKHIERIKSYASSNYQDGRYFRTSYENGGYEGMDSLHGLDRDATKRSGEFIELSDEYLTYPENCLDNFNKVLYGEG